jgi:ADP-heptose:LPS heptosyltransferase
VDSIILPHVGFEFGQLIMTHVRWVHTIPGTKVVCTRRGLEPLFPSATEFFYDWTDVPDAQRHTKTIKATSTQMQLEAVQDHLLAKYPGAQVRFPIDGKKPQYFPNLPQGNFQPVPACPAPAWYPEILVAPRFRKHGEARNFPHWNKVVQDLRGLGYHVGIIGVPETSATIDGITMDRKAWGHDDNLGVTLHWMSKAKMVIATDSGMAHLAVLAGAPLLVVYEARGKVPGPEGWPWILPHMQAHARAFCEPVLECWSRPENVADALIRAVG